MDERVEYDEHSDWPAPVRRVFSHPDGSFYERIDPEDLASYDQVDSTTIVDHGAPE